MERSPKIKWLNTGCQTRTQKSAWARCREGGRQEAVRWNTNLCVRVIAFPIIVLNTSGEWYCRQETWEVHASSRERTRGFCPKPCRSAGTHRCQKDNSTAGKEKGGRFQLTVYQKWGKLYKTCFYTLLLHVMSLLHESPTFILILSFQSINSI